MHRLKTAKSAKMPTNIWFEGTPSIWAVINTNDINASVDKVVRCSYKLGRNTENTNRMESARNFIEGVEKHHCMFGFK